MIKLLARIKSYATAILRVSLSSIEVEDVYTLMDVADSLENLAKKYNPSYFENRAGDD